jgi:hypothetical protein
VTRVKALNVTGGFKQTFPALDKNVKNIMKEHIDILHSHSPFQLAAYFNKIGKRKTFRQLSLSTPNSGMNF